MRRQPRAVRVLVCFGFLLTLFVTRLAGGQEMPAPEAWVALNQGDHARAASLFREALERSPRNAVLHYGAGWAAFALGRNDAAISSLKKALEMDPSFAQAAALLGTVAYAASDLDLAVRSMEKAAALAPRDVRIRAQLDQWRKESALHSSFSERPGVRFRVLFEGTRAAGTRRPRPAGARVFGTGRSARPSTAIPAKRSPLSSTPTSSSRTSPGRRRGPAVGTMAASGWRSAARCARRRRSIASCATSWCTP